jgi:hypothetical protein
MKPHPIAATIGLTILTALSPQPTADNPVLAKPIESAEEHAARIAWWREARFGMFIHWGLYLLVDTDRKSLPIAQNGEKFSVTLPAGAPGKIAAVLCVETK